MSDIGGTLRAVYPRVLARVLHRVRTLAAAEDAVQEAMMRALVAWPEQGVPSSPAAWLVRVAVNHHTDGLRRSARTQKYATTLEQLASSSPWAPPDVAAWDDDMLRLVVTCCDPVLGLEERTALALSTVAGLATEEIARAFLVAPRAMEQRLTRARRRLRQRRDAYEIPPTGVAPERIDAVLAVIHFAFNEGYWSGGEVAIRRDLTSLALSLARSLDAMLPEVPEVRGLLALLVLHAARMPARLDDDGAPVTLEQQDRTRWDRALLAEGEALVRDALSRGAPGAYQIEAAISAVHCAAADAADTDWIEIASLYAALERHRSSPAVRVNRAFALGKAAGPAEGLRLLATIADEPALERYPYAHLVRGVLLAEAGSRREAADALRVALECATNDVERANIRGRLAAL